MNTFIRSLAFVVCMLFVGQAFSQSASESTAPTATTSRVFVTSTTYNGNLGGLAGADAKCQARADAATLGGTWKAWLSTSGSSAAARLPHATGFYRRTDGVLIAHNWADLTDGVLLAQLDRSEFGSQPGGTRTPWTATDEMGNYFQYAQFPGSCNNFSLALGPVAAGNISSLTAWSANNVKDCTTANSLYCFEDPVELGPKSISGLVRQQPTALGQGRRITNALVSLTGASLPSPLTVRTRRDGSYQFNNVPSGVQYTITVSQRRFTFSPSTRTVNLLTNVTDQDFSGAR